MRGAAAGLGGLTALVVLLPMEAGVPIPVPSDLVMFTVGERVAAGAFPLFLADHAFNRAKGPAIAAVIVLAAGALVFWLVRRRTPAAKAAWMEASCPACIGLNLLAERLPALAELTGSQLASSRPGEEPTAMVS